MDFAKNGLRKKWTSPKMDFAKTYFAKEDTGRRVSDVHFLPRNIVLESAKVDRESALASARAVLIVRLHIRADRLVGVCALGITIARRR